jgi:glutamate/tyrosine decarboxylase-like PLP-dependent enzyme
MSEPQVRLPKKGNPKDDVIERMKNMRDKDIRWREGKAFVMIYDPGQEAKELLKEAYGLFLTENALNPTAFPSLRRMETEIIQMTANLLGGDGDVVGNMTTGGTESILMAVKTARNWARVNMDSIKRPEILVPESIHPAFEKAGEYFDVRLIHYPVNADFVADVEAAREKIGSNTIMMAASAPSYPHGVMDPIPELVGIAKERGILFHVDACLGGFLLPFVRKLGYPVPDFDFSVPGVTSISADLHKYGYAAKPASVVLYRDKSIRRHQMFVHTDWSGGIYASPTMTGSRPGGSIAAAWAIMNHLGEEGYLHLSETIMKTAKRIREGVAAMRGLKIIGNPVMSVMALAGDGINIYEVGDEMGLKGWYLERQQFPPSLHLTINYGHAEVVEEFLRDLESALKAAKQPNLRKLGTSLMMAVANSATRLLPEKLVSSLTAQASSLLGVKGASLPKRSAPMYGMMASLPNRGDVEELVLDIVEQFTQPQEGDQ